MTLKSFIGLNLSLVMLHAIAGMKVWEQNAGRGHVSARLTVEPAVVRPGAQATLNLKLRLAADSHVNSNDPKDANLIPTTFTPRQTKGVAWGAPQYPEPVEVTEWYSVDPLAVFRGGAVITVPLTVEATATGTLELSGTLVAQACDHEQCYPPERINILAPLPLAGGTTAPAKTAQADAPPQKKTEAEIHTQPGSVDFNFTDFDGKARKLSEFRGKVVLLDFWATWCSPCIGDFPHLKELYAKHKSSGFEIIGLDCETLGDDAADADTIKAGFEQAKSIVARFGTSWTMAEPRSAVAVAEKHFQVESLPTKILIDRQGKIVKTVKSRAELEESLVQSLRQQ